MIWLTAWEAKRLLVGKGRTKFSPDLGISWDYANVNEEGVVFPTGDFLGKDTLKRIARDPSHVYFIKNGQLFKAVIFDNGNVYKLTPVQGGAPTHEINGIRMHRVKDTTPDRAVKRIFYYVHIGPKDYVLDICTGLGYTAQEAARRGAKVTTIEKDQNVLELSKINPWSMDFWKFVETGKIKLIVGDAFEVVRDFDDGSFSTVIHDPPRFAMAGELYSLEFYRELYRVTRPGGVLFHYTGNPGERFRRKSVSKGVIERLREAGWRDVKRLTEIQGVLARKPSRIA